MDHAALLSLVLLLGTHYQQPFKTYHHPVYAAILKLNYLAGHMVFIHCSTCMIAFTIKMGNISYLSYLLRYLLSAIAEVPN